MLPQLERENPRAAQAIGRMSALLRQDRDYLEAQAAQAARELARGDGLDAAGTAALHPALRWRVLAGLLARQGIECSAQRVRALEQLLGYRRRVRLTGDWYAVVRRGVLRLEPSAPAGGPIRPRLLPKSGLDGLWVEAAEGKWLHFSVINCADYENFENISSAYLNLVMDYDKITGDILLRARQPGDRIRPAGRGCSKDLRRAFSELALPDRERLCVLADQEGILCAEGVGIDQRVSPDEGSGRLLRIALCGEDGCTTEMIYAAYHLIVHMAEDVQGTQDAVHELLTGVVPANIKWEINIESSHLTTLGVACMMFTEDDLLLEQEIPESNFRPVLAPAIWMDQYDNITL